MNKYILEDTEYKLIENYKDGFNFEELKNKYTDYFKDYDYIIGDWAYGKLRLKGFCSKNNPNLTNINDFSMYKDYIRNHCAYECKYFVVEKIVK